MKRLKEPVRIEFAFGGNLGAFEIEISILYVDILLINIVVSHKREKRLHDVVFWIAKNPMIYVFVFS